MRVPVDFLGASFRQLPARGEIRPEAPFCPIYNDFYPDKLYFALGRTTESMCKMYAKALAYDSS